jgi:hypothetical protein
MAQVYFHCSNVKAELVECGTAVDDLAEVLSDAIVESSCRNWLSLTPRVKSVNWRIVDVRYATEISQAPTAVA